MSYQGGPYWQYPSAPPPPAPPPVPPNQPPSRRPSRWPAFATERGILLYVLAPLLALLLVVLLAVGISAARQRPVAQSPTPTAGPPAPTITPQGTPLATDTPVPTSPPSGSLVTGPTMGGTTDAFSASYGDNAGQGPGFGQWTATIAGHSVQIMVDFSDAGDATDDTPRAIIINLLSPGGGGWDAATSRQIALEFVPPDARFVGATAGPTGHTDENYVSPSLASSLNASIFTTDDGSRQVTPGSVYWTCDQPTGCYMAVGTYN